MAHAHAQGGLRARARCTLPPRYRRLTCLPYLPPQLPPFCQVGLIFCRTKDRQRQTFRTWLCGSVLQLSQILYSVLGWTGPILLWDNGRHYQDSLFWKPVHLLYMDIRGRHLSLLTALAGLGSISHEAGRITPATPRHPYHTTSPPHHLPPAHLHMGGRRREE